MPSAEASKDQGRWIILRKERAEQAGSVSKGGARNEGQGGTCTGSSPLSAWTRRRVFEQAEVAGRVGIPAGAIQVIHTAPLETNSSRKAGNPVVVGESQGPYPRIH